MTFAAAIVAILPAFVAGYLAAHRLSGWGPGAFGKATVVFAAVFAAVYVASAYALIAWALA